MKTSLQIGAIPVDYSVLRTLFAKYKFPKNKIASLEEQGELARLKRGMYVLSPASSGELLSLELIANRLYGPSYVSMQSALRYYGLIPERVPGMLSVTTGRSKMFENSLGVFRYMHAAGEYYAIGIEQRTANEKYTFLIASPEKALCDLVLATPHLYFQSVKAAGFYLEEDLRCERDAIEKLDATIIEQCIAVGKKQKTLEYLLKAIRK